MCLQLQNFARAMRYKTVDQSQKERHIQCMCASGQDAMNHILKTIRLRMRCAALMLKHCIRVFSCGDENLSLLADGGTQAACFVNVIAVNNLTIDDGQMTRGGSRQIA